MNNLIGAVFAFLLSVSAVGNLVTGYDLKVTSMTALFLWCACCSLISAFLFGFKYGGAVWLGLCVLAAPVIWKGGLLWEQLQSLCYTISEAYHNAYNWPILGKPITNEADLPLIVLSLWVAAGVSWSYCCRKNVFLAIPSVILPVVICMITTDKVPDEIYLYLLLLGMAMLFVTDWTRRKNPVQGSQLTLRLAIPMAAALALIFVINPQQEYINNESKYQKEVVSWLQKLWDTTQFVGSGVSFGSGANEKLDLTNVGPKSGVSYTVMRVNAPFDGTVYLRGRDYDMYSGTGWESSLNRNETFTSGGIPSGKISIVTDGVRNVLYVPYYSTEEILLVGGAVDNDENLQKYSYHLSRSAFGGSDKPDSGYTRLPSATLQWASGLDIFVDSKTYFQSEKIRRIESYVKKSATYDLATSRMDSDHDDFARWFLEDSNTGYCVHFATAATVLLRAAGIPARYVEGYMVTCKAGEDVEVSNLDAHAWAEYYDSASGTWRILEATPADFHDEEEPEETVSTTEKTEPPLPETKPPLPETEPPLSETKPDHSKEEAPPPQINDEIQPIGQDGIAGSTGNKDTFTLPNWLKAVFWILFVAALVPLQAYIRVGWKRWQWNRGRSNEKLIARWRQSKKAARIINHPFPAELEELAQKANFSQHRIRSDELQLFENYREDLLETVRSKPWYRRILLRWLFAIGR